MIEDPVIVRMNIKHYEQLLKLRHHSHETRTRVEALLLSARGQLDRSGPPSR